MAGFKSNKKVQKFRTICEVHREIYDIVYDNMPDGPAKQDIENKLEEAFLMAKKMNDKLRQYKFDYDDNWWELQSQEIRKEKYTLRNSRDKNGTYK